MLRLEGRGPIPSTKYLNLIEVGRAVLKPGTPFAPFVLPAPQTEMVARAVRYHTPAPSPVVIANGVQGLSHNTELETFYRSYGWFLPIGGGDVHPWSVGSFAGKVSRLTAQIDANSDQFSVTAPTETLTTAAGSSRAAARRLLLLGGEGGALLLAFTVLAAAALRRDTTDARRRLTWFGARRWQVELFTLAESVAVATLATLAGWVAGGAVAAAVASRADSPAGEVVGHALLSRERRARRALRRRRGRSAALRDRARAGSAVRAARVHAARRRRDSAPSPSCSSAGHAAPSTRSSSPPGRGRARSCCSSRR